MEPATQEEASTTISKIKHIFEFVIKVRWFTSALIALSIFFFIKRFAVDIIRVNNHDMESSFSKGDAVLIKKIFNTYHSNDLLYFEYPIEDSSLSHVYIIQRLYGLPGDSIELIEKKVYINNTLMPFENQTKYNYFIKTKKIKPDSAFNLKYKLTEGGEISVDYDYSYSLTEAESVALRKDSIIQSVELKMEKKMNYDETCFPSDAHFKWNMDFFGKLYIPKKDDTLQLDSINLKLYLPIIEEYEMNKVYMNGDIIFINGQNATSYIIKKNYFFVLGDNRDNANDSRIWGFLPENFIKGKVIGRIRKK